MKNLTKVKIPKKYNEAIEILWQEEIEGSTIYKVRASEGFIFPTIHSTEGQSNSHKGIWNIIRYVEAGQIEEPIVIFQEVTEEPQEVTEEPQEGIEEKQEVTEEKQEGTQEEETHEKVRATEEMTIKELWAIGKELGFKGCTRWAKAKLIKEINEYTA